ASSVIWLDGNLKASRNDMAGSGGGCNVRVTNRKKVRFDARLRYVRLSQKDAAATSLPAAKPDALRHTRRLARQGVP
ncbi:hypothetical protein, partial [Xanthomonas oryzae]